MIIEGIIRTKSKLHVTSATDGQCKINSQGEMNRPNSTISLSRTYRTPVATSSGIQEIPFFPANSMVGRLRRYVTQMILDSLSQRDLQITRTCFRGLTCGSGDSSPETGALFVEDYAAYLKNPFMGLFGGTKRLYESGFDLNDMMPVVQATLESGMVPVQFEPNMAVRYAKDGPVPTNYVTAFDVLHRRDDLMSGVSEEVIQTISDYSGLSDDMEQEVARKAQAALVRSKGGKATKATPSTTDEAEAKIERASMAQQSAREYVVPGTPLYYRAKLRSRCTPEQIGLFFLGLEALLNENRFGGASHLGYGQLNLQDVQNWVVHTDSASSAVFSCEYVAGEHQVKVVHPEIVKHMKAAQAWIDNVSPQELEPFYKTAKAA